MDREHSCTIGDARPLAAVAFLQFGPSIRMIETSTDENEGMQELKQTLPRTDLTTVLIKNVILCTILQHTTWYCLPFLIPFICFHFLHAAILPQPTIRGKKITQFLNGSHNSGAAMQATACQIQTPIQGPPKLWEELMMGLWGPVTSSPSSNPSSLLLDGGLIRSTIPALRLSTLIFFLFMVFWWLVARAMFPGTRFFRRTRPIDQYSKLFGCYTGYCPTAYLSLTRSILSNTLLS